MSTCPLFFQKECILLYHGDSLEILPQLGKFDWMFCDPPYGTELKSGYRRSQTQKFKCGNIKNDESLQTFQVVIDILKPVNLASFCSPKKIAEMINIIPLPYRGEIIWDKKNAGLGSIRYRHESILIFSLEDLNLKSQNSIFSVIAPARKNAHPHEKPLNVIGSILDIINPKSVIDPFAGTGVIGEACLERNIPYVGIEIEMKWCQLAKKRLSQNIINLKELNCRESELPIQTRLPVD